MVKLWITETEQNMIIEALGDYKKAAEADDQWDIFICAIEDLRDRIFHAGDEDNE